MLCIVTASKGLLSYFTRMREEKEPIPSIKYVSSFHLVHGSERVTWLPQLPRKLEIFFQVLRK